MLSGTEHVLITILKKTRSEKLLKPVFFLYSPESCVPTTAEHTKGPLEQNFLSSVTRRNPIGIFVKFEINLERWVRYISRGAISPAGADLLLVNDRLLFLKDWKKNKHTLRKEICHPWWRRFTSSRLYEGRQKLTGIVFVNMCLLFLKWCGRKSRERLENVFGITLSYLSWFFILYPFISVVTFKPTFLGKGEMQ